MRGDKFPGDKEAADRAGAIPLNVDGIQASALRLLNAVGDGVLALDDARRVVYSNTAAQELLGLDKQKLLGLGMDALLNTTEPDVLFDSALRGDVVSTDECVVITRDGREVPVLLTAVPLAPEALAPGAGDKPVNRENGGLELPPGLLSLEKASPDGRGVILVFRENSPAAGSTSNGVGGAPTKIAPGAGTEPGESPAPAELISEDLDVLEKVPEELVSSLDEGEESKEAGAENASPELETAISVNNQIKVLLTDLLAETGPDHTIQTALHGVVALTQADFAVIGLYAPSNRMIQYRYSYGFFESIELEVPLLESAAAEMFQSREILSIPDYPSHPRRIPFFVDRGVRTYLGAPLFAENSPIGIVALFRETDAPFRAEEEKILYSLAPVISAALFKAKYEERLAELATKDSLTGLWNRRVAFEHLDREIARFNRYGTPLSVILMDLDYFKTINDSYGHLAGDEVLRRISRVMGHTSRDSDLAARTGGEEFMIILPDTKLPGARSRAEKLREDIAAMEIEFQDLRLQCTASMGCAEFQKNESPEEFYARLDGLLYLSKNNGRNRVSS